jgi:hypothetical protein
MQQPTLSQGSVRPAEFVFLLEYLVVDLEMGFWMCTQWAQIRCLAAFIDIPAVAANPEYLFAALENDFIFQVGNKL